MDDIEKLLLDIEKQKVFMDAKKKRIDQLIERLNQPYRIIMYLKYITFLTFDQIADQMNYSTKRIYQLHSEGVNKLQELINNENSI